MASFVFCHFMNRVMDSVEVELFCQRSQFFFASASALFCGSAEFEVGLRVVCYDFAKEFGKFSCVFSFFKCNAFVSFGNFRIA